MKINKTAKKTLGEKVQDLEKVLQNNSVALQLMQQMILRFNNDSIRTNNEIGNITGHLQNLEYRTRALIHNSGLSVDLKDLEEKADAYKLKDFEEASQKEDTAADIYPIDEAKEDSIVYFTSSVEGKEDAGVFRSRLPIQEAVSPEIKDKLIGTKTGDEVSIDLNGEVHLIKILGVKGKLPAPTELAEAAEA